MQENLKRGDYASMPTKDGIHSCGSKPYSRIVFLVGERMARPVIREWPFMFVFLLLMGLWEAMMGIIGFCEVINADGVVFSKVALYRWISIWLMMAYILAVLIDACRRWYVKVLCYFVPFFVFVVQHFLMQNFWMRISPMCLMLIAETTRRESSEFARQWIFSTSSLPTLKITTLYLFIACALEGGWHVMKERVQLSAQKNLCVALLTLVVLTCGVCAARVYGEIYKTSSPDDVRHIIQPEDPFSSIYASSITIGIMERNMQQAVEKTIKAEEARLDETMLGDSLNIVLVIGESYIKWHSQLYGYALQTNPYLKHEKDAGRLYVFNDVVTPSNMTTEVIRNLLCCNNSGVGEQWYDFPFFPALFKHAGYHVEFWDNQLEYDPLATFSFTLNSFLYHPDVQRLSYDKTNDRSYNWDADIVKVYADSVGVPSTAHNFVMFHLVGQHHDVNTRFPHDETFEHFTADSIKRKESYLDKEKKEYIANYDNATLYNDFVLSQIIKIFENRNTVLVYLSDHGEEVYDYRDQRGRSQGVPTSDVVKYQYEIPFMIWCSESYKKYHPDIVNSIAKALNNPFMIDNLCHLLFHIGGIQTSYYKEKYDLISPYYSATRRIIKGQYDFDTIRKKRD